MLVMLVVNGINIAGSWILLSGKPALGIPAIGVIGSACGAASGWILGALFALYLVRHTRADRPRLQWANIVPHRETMRRILHVGLPSTVELVIFQLGVVSFLRVVVGLGPTVYAANVAINTIESIGTLPALGFSVAATALVGQALGAGDPELAAPRALPRGGGAARAALAAPLAPHGLGRTRPQAGASPPPMCDISTLGRGLVWRARSSE